MTPRCQPKHTHIRESNAASIQERPGTQNKNLVLHCGKRWGTLLVSVIVEILGQLLISCKGWKEEGSAEFQPSPWEQIWAVSLGVEVGVGVEGVGEVKGKKGVLGVSRGRSTFSHLYSPKVQSSSFMGWNSGSVCASSFSLTWKKRRWSLNELAYDGETRHMCNLTVKLLLLSSVHSCSLFRQKCD